MAQRSLLAVSLSVLLLVGGVQLLDPPLDGRAPAESVDFSQSPNQVALDSAARFERVDYTYRIDVSDDRSGSWKRFVEAQVDHSNHRYRSVGPLGDDGITIYGNDAATFARPGFGEPWQIGLTPETTYPAPTVTQPVRLDESSAITLIQENASWQVIRVGGVPLKIGPDTPGHADIFIEKDSGLIMRVIVEYTVGGGEVDLMRFTVVDVGTTIERPSDLPYTFREFVGDLARGPVFHDLIAAL